MDDSKASILFRCRIGFCILMAVAVIWATLGFFSGRSVSTALRDMDAATSLLRNQMDADGDRAAIRGGVMAMLAARSAPSIDAQTEGKETLARITELRMLMGKTQAFDGAPEVHAAAIAVNADIASYLETADAMTRQILSGQDVSPEQVERFRETFSKLDGGMSRISDKVEEHVRSTRETAEFAALVGIVSGLGCLALVCCSIYGVWRRVRVTAIVPMMAIGKNVERMSQDELEVVVPFTANGDEIGNLARAAERLRDKLLRADAAREEQERTIVSSLGEALSRMAAGDMTVHLDQNLGGVFERLRHDFNQAVSDLARTLRMVSDATGETLNTSREISASVSDLSARNEQQSASVESIAGSISGVTGRIVEAAQSAALAQTAVDEVNSEVTQGGQVISSAVDAMDRIEASSREIGNIISVIDGISFQTNLLALNAGVEAARAGEAGKGFAVVATEVRALAQRSADAANQIKDLITVSSGEVETGVRLVREAGASLQAIMVRMAEIAAIMEQLSAGASEQSSALTEIDRGTKGLEQITRSNAALAEEVSAATRQVVSATEEVSLKLSSLIFAAGPVGTSTRNAGFMRSRAA